MCIVVEEFWCNDVHFAILLLYPSIRKTVHVRPWMRSTFKNNPLRMKKKIMCSVWYWNQSRNEISMSVILDFMNTAVPNCQGCRRSKGNACWTYILVFQIQLLESSQSLVMILWRSHRLIVHSYIRPETWPLECHQRTNVLPSVSNKLLQEFYLDWCDTCHVLGFLWFQMEKKDIQVHAMLTYVCTVSSARVFQKHRTRTWYHCTIHKWYIMYTFDLSRRYNVTFSVVLYWI